MAISQILFDLDGVVADFVTGALKACGSELTHDQIDAWDMEKRMGITAEEFWRRIDAVRGFWEDLEPYPWARDLYAACREIAPVTFSTSPSFDPLCYAGKVLWIRRHLEPGCKSVMLGKDKHLMAKPGHVLLDDSDANCEKFREHGGDVVLFPMPWNENRRLSAVRVDYAISELRRLAAGAARDAA